MSEGATPGGPPAPTFESPLHLRRHVGPHVRRVRAIARPYKGEAVRFSKFLVVGALGFVVDFGAFNLLTLAFGLPPALAGLFSLICAILSNFMFNQFWIYRDAQHKSHLRKFVQFFLVSVSIAVVRVPLVDNTHVPLAQLARTAFGLAPQTATIIGNNTALGLAVVIALFWNFFVNRFWTYRHVPRA